MKTNRLFEIIYILLERKTITASELAKHFEVSQRTVYRDIDMLSQSGIPVYMSKGKGGGISLLPGYILNKAVLTEEERTEILSSVKAMNSIRTGSAAETTGKLGKMLGSAPTDWIEVDFSSWNHTQNDVIYFEKLKSAILNKKVVTFSYTSSRSETLTRKVMPLRLVFKGAAWYLYGYCTMRNDYRFFKMRRIGDLFVTEESFEKQVPQKLFTDNYIDRSKWINVLMRISPVMAFRIYDEIENYTQDENGDFICQLLLPDVDTVCSYAATYGEYCTVISPEDVKKEIKKRIEKTLENYL